MLQLPFRKLVSHTGLTLALQELLYGFIMALIFISAARLGILDFNGARGLIILILGMNFTWGAIDAVLFYIVGYLDQRRHMMILSSDLPREERARMLMEELNGTAVDMLDEDDARRICDSMLDMRMQGPDDVREDRASMVKSSIACFIITVLTAIPVVVPLALIDDLEMAMLAGSCLASIMMMLAGYYTGKVMCSRPLRFSLLITAIAWAITIIATYTGG